MCEHLYSCICKTVWSADESWEEYVESVRVYDPTAVSFKRIHYALLFGHGLDTVSDAFGDDSTRYRMRPAPSQQNIVHGQSVSDRIDISLIQIHVHPLIHTQVPLRRLCSAGLRMLNVNEGHLEHRHMIRKSLINLNTLHQIARSIGKGNTEQEPDKITRDCIRRVESMMAQQHLQMSKMWFRGLEAFKKNSWACRYRKQVRIIY